MKSDRLFGLSGSNPDRSSPRSRVVFWFSVLLAGLFLYLALRNLEWTDFFAILRNAQVIFLPFFLFWGSLSYMVRAYRWKILLSFEKPITISPVFLGNMAGYLGNTVLPARAGELVRAAYLSKQTGISISHVIATGLTERLMDVMALVTLGSLSLLWTGLLDSTLGRSLALMGLLGVVGLITILKLPQSTHLMEKLVERIPRLHQNQKRKIHSVVQNFLIGLAPLSDVKRTLSFTGLTLIIWLMDAASIIFLSYVLSLPLFLSQAFVLLAALGLSSAIPSTPGYVGVYQFAAIWALQPFGVSSENAVALIILVQILNLVVVGIWGLVAAVQFSNMKPVPTSE